MIDAHCDTENKPTGQTECVLSLRKIVTWLEDLDGNMVASPALCIGNVGFSDLHATRFCLGTANCLYTNDPDLTNLPEDPTSRHKQYCDEYYLGTTLTKTNLFQGAPADEYGYCAVLICAADRSEGKNPWIDEMTVFLVSDVRTVTVTKEVVGGDPTEQFPFVETHDIYDEKALARFRSRMAEIDDAIVCEACRWGRSDQKTRETWLKNCDECLYFITNRLTHMTQQYRNKGWYPSIDAPTVTIADGKETFTAANPVYYTLDGSDPRTNGILAEGDVTLPASGTTVVRARCKSGAEWSAMDESDWTAVAR